MVSSYYNDPAEEKEEKNRKRKLREYYEHAKVEQRLRMAEREPYGRTRGHEMVRQYLIQTAHRHVDSSPTNSIIIPWTLHTWLHMRYSMRVDNQLQLKEIGSNQLSRSFLPRSRKKIPLQVAKQIIQDMWYFGRSHLWEDYIQENEKWLEQQRIKILAEQQQQRQWQQKQILEQEQENTDLLKNDSCRIIIENLRSEDDTEISKATSNSSWNDNEGPMHDFFDR
jgi:hypothetical protein